MGNPFDFFTGGSSGGGNTIDAQTAANGPSTMNRIFNPDKGGLFGMIGDITGQHSNAERMSAVDANILQKLSGFYQSNGGDEQRSILSLLNDPVGHDLMSRPGAADTLKRWHDSVQPTVSQIGAGNAPAITKGGNTTIGQPVPPTESQNFNNGVPQTQNTSAETTTTQTQKGPNGQPQVTNTVQGPPRVVQASPGGDVGSIDASGNRVGQGMAQATVPVQNFAYFSKACTACSESDLSTMAANQLPGADLTQKTNHLTALLRQGKITPEYYDKFLSDQIMIMQGIGETGEPNHIFHSVDKTNGTAMQLTPNPTMAPGDQSLVIPSAVQGGKPNVFPASGKQADGSYDVNSLIAADPIDNMFLGSGIGNHILSLSGQLVRSTVDPRNPERSSQLSAFRHDRIDQFQTAVAMLGSINNNRLSSLMEKWEKDTPGKFTDPKDAYNQAIGLRSRLETMKAQNEGYLDPKRGGGPARHDSKFLHEQRQELSAIQNVLTAMPTIPAMEQKLKEIQVLPGTALGLGGVAKGIGGIVGGAFNDAVGSGGSGDGAAVRAARIKARNATQPQQPGANNAPPDISSMDIPTLQAHVKNSPTLSAEDAAAVRARYKELSSGKKPTTGQGNPPASGATNPAEPMDSNGPMKYDMQSASREATPPLEDWLQNPSGERNIIYKGPNDTINGAKYGSDGNWHVMKDGKWMTIVPITGKKTKGPTMGGSERPM